MRYIKVRLFFNPTCTFYVKAATMSIREGTIDILKKFDIGNRFCLPAARPKASVLIPLFVKNGRLYTLMTLRSKEVNPKCPTHGMMS